MTELYSDITFTFKNDKSGNVQKVTGSDSISQSIRMILTTGIGERVMLPEFGSRIKSLVFETMDDLMVRAIELEVEEAIKRWEPRVAISGVYVTPNYDKNLIEVDISYTIIENGETDNFTGTLQARG